ncbi:MAG: response regulator [Candidatus Eisenbacteria sp.]|nr:response regulator [Candidatus Eisenbacteria bacterium]
MKDQARILLIDRDDEFLSTLKTALEGRGYIVATAASGQDGLEVVRANMPDLIIMEVMLENHDTGFSVTHQLKIDPLFGKIPVLLVSAVAQATGYHFTQEEDGFWMKSDDYLERPIDTDTLLQRVEALLKRDMD